MGTYLNPGNSNFREAVNADIYVDKTMMIDKRSLVTRLNEEVKAEIISEFPKVEIVEGDSLAQSILKVYAATDKTHSCRIERFEKRRRIAATCLSATVRH